MRKKALCSPLTFLVLLSFCPTSQASSGVQLSYLEFSPSCLVPSWLAFPISPTQVEIQFSLAPFYPLIRSWCEWFRWAGASVIRAGHRAPSQVFTQNAANIVAINCYQFVWLLPVRVVSVISTSYVNHLLIILFLPRFDAWLFKITCTLQVFSNFKGILYSLM